MKLMSYNIRGVGSQIKKKEIQESIRKFKLDVTCLQESKIEGATEEICRSICGSNDCGWAASDSIGRSGGIITLWNPNKFIASSTWNMQGAVVVNGVWGTDRLRCCIVNVYAACPLGERLDLWDRLQSIIFQNSDVCLCLAGDFNSIRFENGRSGASDVIPRRDIRAFDTFISGSDLIDLPLCGRKFTWYRPNSSCKSRIDRILLNHVWVANWPGSI